MIFTFKSHIQLLFMEKVKNTFSFPSWSCFQDSRLIELRKEHNLFQRDLCCIIQLTGYDMEKNAITRIETNKRYVTDVGLCALAQIFDISCDELIFGKKDSEK